MPSTSDTLPNDEIRVLLIDDQLIIGETVRRLLQSESDIAYEFCSDPTLAISAAEKFKPTVILQDLVMPQVDGLTLVKQLRAEKTTSLIPLIVLSSKEEPTIKAQSFANGANDYLVKLPDKIELIARIRHHSAGYINMMERNKIHKELQESQKALSQELQEAADYVRSLLPEFLNSKTIRSDWAFKASSSLGGDAFGYHWIDINRLALYLLDVCGHGVGAALLSISVINVIRSESLPNVDFSNPTEVLSGLNEAFPMESNHNMYFTMWFGIYDTKERSLSFSSGGHPPAILINYENDQPIEALQLRTPGMMIGAMPGLDFKSETTQVPVNSSLFLFSDGVYEIVTPDGKLLELEDFIKVLKTYSPQKSVAIDSLVKRMEKIQGHESFEDDFSIVRFNL